MSVDVVRRSLTLHGRRISYLTLAAEIAGPLIVLIHGSGVSARYWVEQLRGLAPPGHAVALDLPGHGQSDDALDPTAEHYADVVGDFVEALGVGPAIAVGHSLGGAVALALAARRPPRSADSSCCRPAPVCPRRRVPRSGCCPSCPGRCARRSSS